MKWYLITLTVLTVLGTGFIAMFDGIHSAVSFFSGAALMLGNLLVIAYAWSNILAKKLIAWSIAVIVIKYAVLGIIVFELVFRGLVDLGWFGGGMAMLLLSSIGVSLVKAYLNPLS